MMWLGLIWLVGVVAACRLFASWGDLKSNAVYAAIWPLWVPLFLLLLAYELVGGFVCAMRDNR